MVKKNAVRTNLCLAKFKFSCSQPWRFKNRLSKGLLTFLELEGVLANTIEEREELEY